MQLLTAVASLALPDCYVAAGCVRSLVWDHLYGYKRTPLNDVDVVFFDRAKKAFLAGAIGTLSYWPEKETAVGASLDSGSIRMSV